MPGGELRAAPATAVDGQGCPRFGTFRGELEQVGLGALAGPYQAGWVHRLLRRKRWQFAVVASPEVVVAFAVADLGYAGNAFVQVVGLGGRDLVLRRGVVCPPGPHLGVNDFPGPGLRAHCHWPGMKLLFRREKGSARLELFFELDGTRGKPPARFSGALTQPQEAMLTVVAPVPGGILNVTEKGAGLAAEGLLEFGREKFSFNPGWGGTDYTQGVLSRRTDWRWAMAAGRLPDGTRLGLNLVEGFNESVPEANENALWVGNELFQVSRAQFDFSRQEPGRPWTVTTERREVSLRFVPRAAHSDHRDLGVVRSRFVQPVGAFEGCLAFGGRTVEVADWAGVTESQDVLW